ncbi:hypothetical protein KAW18_11645 [candidate division WOR-3 bacterium]|nr:hypothetical protein [candidate division WOR-3 bacterium]
MHLEEVNNTFIFPKNEDVEIEVGDIKQPDFKPRMKIKRWDNEVNFSVGLISDHKGTHTEDINDKHTWDDGHGIKANFYKKEEHQFEFEVILDEKPQSNVINISIETKGLDFFYQPPLTQEEIDDGHIRPDDVVGSYAVHHSTKKGNYVGGNNYRAGKFCHIYRPYATDANGLKVWCDLHISNDMQIAIPHEFLDKAVYPITIDPTFGVNPSSPGGTAYYMPTGRVLGSLFTSPANIDKAQSFTAYMRTAAAANMKALLVLHSNLNIITDGIGAPVSLEGAPSWSTSIFGTDPDPENSTEYVLMAVTSATGYLYYDFGDANQGHQDNTNSYSSPTNPTDATHNANEYSIYCTYTEGAPPAGVRPPRVFYGPFRGPFGGPIQ